MSAEAKEVKKPTVEDFREFGKKVGETAKSATENKNCYGGAVYYCR